MNMQEEKVKVQMKQIQLLLSAELHRFAKVSAAVDCISLNAWLTRLITNEAHKQETTVRLHPNGPLGFQI